MLLLPELQLELLHLQVLPRQQELLLRLLLELQLLEFLLQAVQSTSSNQ